jgi:hypothetical protein
VTPQFEISNQLSADSWQPIEHGVDGIEIIHSDIESIVRLPLANSAQFVRLKLQME